MVGGSRLSGGHANAFVVVHVLNGHLGAFLGDVLKARLAAALGHMYHSLLPQLMRCPGHAAAMVSVGGGEEGCLAKLPLQLFTGEVVVGHLGHVPPHLVGDVACHGEGAAQYLECVETKAEGLVLDEQAAQTQILRHAVKPSQGRDGILGETGVEISCLGHLVKRHNGEVFVRAGGHVIVNPFDFLFHIESPAHKNFLAQMNFLCRQEKHTINSWKVKSAAGKFPRIGNENVAKLNCKMCIKK